MAFHAMLPEYTLLRKGREVRAGVIVSAVSRLFKLHREHSIQSSTEVTYNTSTGLRVI